MSLLFVNTVLGWSNLLIHITIILGLITWIIKKDIIKQINPYFKQYGILTAFIISLIATISSLYYSNYIGFEPCTLCWYQRILIYPQVILLGLAIKRKETTIIPYSITLAIIASIISIYHYIIQVIALNSPTTEILTVCNDTASCVGMYLKEFGYISLPLMALTTSISIIILLKKSR